MPYCTTLLDSNGSVDVRKRWKQIYRNMNKKIYAAKHDFHLTFKLIDQDVPAVALEESGT
jgi:hypothetical protein